MPHPRNSRLPFLLLSLLSFPTLAVKVPAQGKKEDYDRAASLAPRTENKVFRTGVRPVWLPGGERFWYRVDIGPDRKETVLVDAANGTREVVTDPSQIPGNDAVKASETPLRIRPSRNGGENTEIKLVNQLAEDVDLFWIDPAGGRQAYGRIRAGAERGQNTYSGHVWLVTGREGKPLAVFEAADIPLRAVIDAPSPTAGPGEGRPGRGRGRGGDEGGTSPDGNFTVEARAYNLFLRQKDAPEAVPLTSDGTEDNRYTGRVFWSPDSGAFTALRVKPGQEHPVHIVESSPRNQLQPRLFTHDYLKPGDKLPKPELVVVTVADKSVKPVSDGLFPNPFTTDGNLQIRWQPDSKSFTFEYNQRGHQVFRLLSVDRGSLAVRPVVEETSPTFIDYNEKTWHEFLDETHELLWMSELDGWCHLYLYDTVSGQVKNRITGGQWVVRGIESVDRDARQVWFYAGGQAEGQDPYQRHLCRVNFDGTGFVRLTQGDGDHRIRFSPDRRWFVDTWSRPDQAPVTELRRSTDGTLAVELERGDWSALLAAGWTVPERFVAKGRDGVTDIYGTIIKPSNFDPARSWPVLEEIYAGPQGAFTAKEFGRGLRQHGLAELGFIVVQADGMGTNHRGKKFHEVCWKNLADAGFADRIAWMKAAAASRPWMDLKHVGIYGGSAGGQNAMRALLDHHDFYSAAVADCGCHDNRMDKIWWNEQWMGWPVDESYARSSNVDDAGKLEGHLFLTVGEMDTNVDPASTMQAVNALVKAGKDFDLLVVPGSDHGAGESPYAARRRMDFFVRHLMGVEPRL
ncbi:MAG: ptpA 2 [Verrucomicrobiales bacterium]|nr:ptpA 2 [Verrucomicrobiales bacterium]